MPRYNGLLNGMTLPNHIVPYLLGIISWSSVLFRARGGRKIRLRSLYPCFSFVIKAYVIYAH